MPEDAPVDLQTLLKRFEELRAELAATKAELARKDQIIAALQQRLFGRSSERLDPDQLQFELDEAALGKPEPPPQTGGGSEAGSEEADGARKRSRRPKADLFPENLPVIVAEVIVPDEVLADPEGFVEIGEEHHDELEAVRAELYWSRQVRKKFVSKADRNRPPLIAPAPEPSVPGTLCGPQLMAQILVDKYCDHLPHYRQSKRFLRRYQVSLSRQTLGGWTHAGAAHMEPIGEVIKAELREADILQIDESPMDYLAPGCGKTAQGYLWYYRDAERGTMYCDWQLGRGHDCLLEILGLDEASSAAPFEGVIQCDGYSAYRALVARYGGIRLGGCLAHIRRKFFEARQQAPEVVLPILGEIGELYRIERWLRQTKAPPKFRHLIRRARSRPIVEALHEKILDHRSDHLPQSNLGRAIGYALGEWEGFVRYLEDGRMEIDNNEIENAIRPAKLGLKNYLFFGGAEAGKSSALIYTLLANCAVQDLDPEHYLAEAIKRLPPHPTPEQAAELTPAKLAPRLGAESNSVASSAAA